MHDLSSAIQAAAYVQEGIAAIRAGDKATARRLLEAAIQFDSKNEDAWLWLSGAATDRDEQRHCLETVILLNPHHTGARQGLAMLAAKQPPAPSAPPAGEQPPQSASPDTARAYQGVTQRLAPAATPATTPQQTADPAAVRVVIRALGQGLLDDDVCRTLCETHAMAWSDAQRLVAHVRTRHARSIARRQSPYLLVLSIGSLIGGLFMTTYLVRGAIVVIVDPLHSVRLLSFMIRSAPLWLSGIGGTFGGLFGIVQTIGSLWAKNHDS